MRTVFTLLLTVITIKVVMAQKADFEPIVLGESKIIHSNILNQNREVWIAKPYNYDSRETRYHVLYVLDGRDNFHHIAGMTHFMYRRGVIPPLIVIGILNPDRESDFLPESEIESEMAQTEAGNFDSFLKFLENELIPYVDANYRTRDYRILNGHSFGGHFAINALIQSPGLFDATIAMSPSLGWSNHEIVNRFSASTSSILFLSRAQEDNQFHFEKGWDTFLKKAEKLLDPDKYKVKK